MLVLAENFKQDKAGTIQARYPNSKYSTSPNVPADSLPINADTELDLGTQPFDTDTTSIQLYLELDTVATATTDQTKTWDVLGVSFGAPYTSASLTVAGYLVPKFTSAKSLNLIIDKDGDGHRLTLFVDGKMVLGKKPIADYVPTSKIGASTEAATQYEGLPTHITGLALARDSGPKKRISSLTAAKLPLTVGDKGTWYYSEQGYVHDTDKADPTEKLPNVYSTALSGLEFDFTNTDGLVNLYVAASSEDPTHRLVVNNDPAPLTATVTAMPVVQATNKAINISLESQWVSNGLGLEYAGEYNLIGYRELEDKLGFTLGTPMTENAWLRVRLDGVEMYVAKTTLRNSVSWDQIYAAGLVYGTDDNGLAPVGTPVNQLRTITINGRTYKVRLLKGADTDPSPALSTYDASGTENSEWSRIFYPLCSDDQHIVSYTGPKIAQIPMVKLDQGTRRCNWVQEMPETVASERMVRGDLSPSHLKIVNHDLKTLDYGWRPVLERLT